MKRKISLFLVLCMVMSLITALPITVSAASSGTCGENATWTYENGTLTISGTGDMWDWDYYEPWFSISDSIKTVIIQTGVTSIGGRAFFDCGSLTSVTIPNSVTSIGKFAFDYCSSLTSINVDADNQYFISLDGNLYNKNRTKLIQYAIGKKDTSFLVPNSVTSIGDYAFYNCDSLTSVSIPNSVTSIGDGAFYDCSSLTSVTIPNSVTSIGKFAFEHCSSLTSINVDADNQYFISLDGNLYNKNRTKLIQYARGKKDTSFLVPNSVTSIGDYAFYACDSLTSVSIPNSVTSIGDEAFYDCSKLKDVYYSGSQEQWKKSA